MKRKQTFAMVITERTIFWVFTSCRIGDTTTFSRTHCFHLWSDRITFWQTSEI